MRDEVSMVVKIEFVVFWVVAPPSVVVGYKHFGGPVLHPTRRCTTN